MIKIPPAVDMAFGIGDFLLTLPALSVATRGRKMVLNTIIHHNQPGMERLIEVVAPNLHVRWLPKKRPGLDWYWNPGDRTIPQYINWATKYGLMPYFSFPPDIIERFEPIKGLGDFILIHARSSTNERWWDHWRELDLSGIRYFILERLGEESFLEGERLHTDLYTVARYILSCKILVCVDSSMMHMANIFNKPSICIRKLNHVLMPNIGESLRHPTPIQVREAIDRFL